MRISTQKVPSPSYRASPTPLPGLASSWIDLFLHDQNISSGNKSSHYITTKDPLHSIYWAPPLALYLKLGWDTFGSKIQSAINIFRKSTTYIFGGRHQASSPLVKCWLAMLCQIFCHTVSPHQLRKFVEKNSFLWEEKRNSPPKSRLAAIVNRSVEMEAGPVDARKCIIQPNREWIGWIGGH